MGKLKIIIIVCGIIVVGTIGTVAIISNNKNSKTNSINSKTQNQILTTAPSKASTSESVTKSETENENETSANSAASNNNASESSSTQSQESTNQVTATNTTSNTSNNTSSNTTTSTNTSTTNVNSNKNLEHDFTFYPATINKNCSLYDATPKYGAMPSLKLQTGQTIFIDPTYPAQKGWVFARTALGAGYLPTSSFTKTSKTKYTLETLDSSSKLYSAASENASIIYLNSKLSYLPNATLVFVPQQSDVPNGWSAIFVGSSATTFKQGYVLSNKLSVY